LKRFEECMSASAKAQEDLEDIEVSVGDLVPISQKRKEKVPTVKSWDFGPSLMTEGRYQTP
jgi:hypothetical protein